MPRLMELAQVCAGTYDDNRALLEALGAVLA
jgi:hypothetical protein